MIEKQCARAGSVARVDRLWRELLQGKQRCAATMAKRCFYRRNASLEVRHLQLCASRAPTQLPLLLFRAFDCNIDSVSSVLLLVFEIRKFFRGRIENFPTFSHLAAHVQCSYKYLVLGLIKLFYRRCESSCRRILFRACLRPLNCRLFPHRRASQY